MLRHHLIVKLIAMFGAIAVFSQTASAQTEQRRGVLQFNQLRELAQRNSTTLSYGTLAQLLNDSNFTGDVQIIVDSATTILEGYTIVNRGGYFPENAGIPREQQLTRAEAVYQVFSLNDGNELVLFRSPLENTAQYFIRTPNNNTF